jgi:hypothetical protein
LRRLDGTETSFKFGECDSIPIVGDWNGDLVSDFGIYSPKTHEWAIDWNHDKQADISFILNEMIPGDIPLVGDWDGDGRDTPGFFRPLNQNWIVFEGKNGVYKAVISVIGGRETSIPLVGDWNLDSRDSWGIYQPDTGEVNLENSFEGELTGIDFILPTHATLIIDDWYGTGRDTVAFLSITDWVIVPANCACSYPNYPPPSRLPIDAGITISGIWP